MLLRAKTRFKDGKAHSYWSMVENRRTSDGRVVQRQVLYLGESNDRQQAAWRRTIEVFDEDRGQSTTRSLFPEDRLVPRLDDAVVPVRLNGLQVRRPRQWGAGGLALVLWEQLALDRFWAERLRPSRKGTRWLNVLKTLVGYRLLDPGSEWRWHRHWDEYSARGDRLGEDAALADSHQLYRCLDQLLAHKTARFSYLEEHWRSLFDARFEVLRYDLTSTYFEADPPEEGKRAFGYSRDKRADGVQVVMALIVTPDGFPLAYAGLAGNTRDKTTLADFLAKIEAQYGKAQRVWIMDRGIPTEDTLAAMRHAETPVVYLVGTPKGWLSPLEQRFLTRSREPVRDAVDAKLLATKGEMYLLARRHGQVRKERAMRRRRLKRRCKRLGELPQHTLTRDPWLLKRGAAKKEAGRA